VSDSYQPCLIPQTASDRPKQLSTPQNQFTRGDPPIRVTGDAPARPVPRPGFSYLEKEFAADEEGLDDDSELDGSFGDPVCGQGGRTRRRLSEHVECADAEVHRRRSSR
jgi:hypothetical protein